MNNLESIAKKYIEQEYTIDNEGYVYITPYFGPGDCNLSEKVIDNLIHPSLDETYEAIDNFMWQWQEQIDYYLIDETARPIIAKIRQENKDLTIAEFDEVKSMVYQTFQVNMSEAYILLYNNNHLDLIVVNYNVAGSIDSDDDDNIIVNDTYNEALSIIGQDNETALKDAIIEFGYDCINCVGFALSVTIGEYIELMKAQESKKEVVIKADTAIAVNDDHDDYDERIHLQEDVIINIADYDFRTEKKGNFYYYHKGDFKIAE